jgi:hypothetical protein
MPKEARMILMRWPRRASWIGEHTRPACGSLRPRDDELLWEVRDGGTPSPAPETGALPSNVIRDQAGRPFDETDKMPRRPHSLAIGRVRPTGGQDGCATMPAFRQGRKTNERRCDETSGGSRRKPSFPFVIFCSRANRTAPRHQLRKLSRVTID